MTSEETKKNVLNFLDMTGMSFSRFGRDVANDPKFVFELLNGTRVMRPKMIQRCNEYICAYGVEN